MLFGKTKKPEGELRVPPAVMQAPDAREIVRFWTGGGKAHVSLSTATPANLPPGNEGVLWGVVLADIARHSVAAIRQSGQSQLDDDQLMLQVTETFLNELGFNREMSGSILEDKT